MSVLHCLRPTTQHTSMCCLQITFQAWDVNEARDLYDQLAVVSPLFMAISAATPMVKGWLLDTDTRWDTISGSVDCRSQHTQPQPSASYPFG